MSKVHKEPFAQVPEWIVYSSASDKAVRVYAALDRHENAGTGRAFPGRAALAGKLGCSVRTIDRAVEELVDIGAVVVENHYRKDGSQSSNSYWLWPRHPDENVTGGSHNGEAPPRQKRVPPSPEVASLIGNETQRDDSQRNESQLISMAPAIPDVTPPRKPHTFPDDFVVTDEMRRWANHEHPSVDVDDQTKRFKDHHLAKGSKFKVWPLAWKNWIRTAEDIGAQRKGNGKSATSGALEYARREGLL